MGSATSGFGRGLPLCAEGPFLVKKGGVWAVFGGFRHPVATQVVRTSSTSHGKPPNLARFLGIPRGLGLFSILIRS